MNRRLMNRHRRGMSFLEISITVLIIGVLAAVSVPRYADSTRAQQAKNAAIQIANYVNYVREVALNEGRSTSIVVDAEGDRFYSSNVNFPARLNTPISIPVKALYDASIELTGDFDGSDALGFDLEGAPTVAGLPLTSGVLRVSSGDLIYEIQVHGGTGLPTLALAAALPDAGSGDVDGTSGATY